MSDHALRLEGVRWRKPEFPPYRYLVTGGLALGYGAGIVDNLLSIAKGEPLVANSIWLAFHAVMLFLIAFRWIPWQFLPKHAAWGKAGLVVGAVGALHPITYWAMSVPNFAALGVFLWHLFEDRLGELVRP